MSRWLLLLFPAILLAWGLYWVLVVITSDGWAVRGQFGDTFGAFNALVSGLAFVAIFIAIMLQRQDLDLQRQELRLQREELELTRRELSRSANAQEQQIFALRLTAALNARAALLAYYSADEDLMGQTITRNRGGAVEQDQKLRKILESIGDLGGGKPNPDTEGTR